MDGVNRGAGVGRAAVALALLAASAGCSGGGSSPSAGRATGAPSSSSAVASVPAGTLEAPALAPGQPWSSSVGDSATYYSTAAGSGRRASVDVGFCAAAGGGPAAASSFSWVLIGSDGRAYRPAGTAPAAGTPTYPDSKLVQAGTCLRGWVGFDVPAGTRIARVAYQPGTGGAPLATWTP
jgi:hypothetical protein